MVPFRVGYCPITGAQSQVTTTRQGVLAGLIDPVLGGSTLVWLCLCEIDPALGLVTKTRVGTVALAPGVDPLTADPLEVEASLLAAPQYSGISTLEPEASMWPGRKLEVVLVYGE